MEKPLVSIVTITRNRGNLLRRCIASVLTQSYTSIEHVVVDGASDDNTDEVVSTFKDERLRFIKLETNWPIKETLDYGISLCQGKYITFLDSDDEYVPEKIEKQVKLIESLPVDYGFVYCWMTYFDNQTKEQLRIHKSELRGDVAEESIGSPCVSGTPTLMFRANVIREIGGWKSVEEIGIASDWEMCARACQKYKVDFVPESLVNVYVNHGSVRQSEGNYYENAYRRIIKFHTYFLNTYAIHIKKKPSLAFYHYWMMSLASIKSRHIKDALIYSWSMMRVSPVKTISEIIKKLK